MRTKVLAGTAIIALAATACSGGGEDGLGTGEDYSVLGALAELPGPPGPGAMIQTGDLTAATELAELERPDTADGTAVVEWIGPLIGNPGGELAPVFVPVAEVFNVQQLSQHEEFHDALGWSLVDADSFAELLLPPENFAVVAGDFDESALADLPEVTDGVVTFGEGEDLRIDMSQVSVVSRIGQPVRFAQQDGRIAVSAHTGAVEDWLAGPDETLADDTALAAVAAALDEQDAVSAVLTTGHSFQGTAMLGQIGASEEIVAQLQEQVEDLPTTAFGTVGIGWAVQDDEPVVVAAYYVSTESAAERAVPEFEAMYRDGVDLRSGRPVAESVELLTVEADGEVVVVRARPAEPQLSRWLVNQLYSRDVPFAHQ